MDNIRKEIKEIKTRLGVIEPTLLMCDLNTKEVVRTQEYVEHRLDVNENMEKRILMLEKYIGTLHTHLNNAITRVNSIHMYLKEQRDEALVCHETIPDSDDDVVSETDEKTEQ